MASPAPRSYASAVEKGDLVQHAYEEAFEDVHTRFLLNLPPTELETADRIFFQIEQAYWFYDDLICDNSELPLPRYSSLKSFADAMFKYSPLLNHNNFHSMWNQFAAYKHKISTYGTILLNKDCTKMVLCKVWNGQSWTFPSGKVNQYEAGTDAGARETYEETGFDPNCQLGLTKAMMDNGKTDRITWKSLREEDGLVFMDQGKRRTVYVCHGVPESFPFSPVARKEVSDVQWHDIDDLPKTFNVLPFMKKLRRWIKNNKSHNKTPSKKRANSVKKSRARNSNSRGRDSRGRVRQDDPLTESGLAAAGEFDGWTEDDMFKANETLLGRKVEYDGNPHHFSEKGFDGRDPHAFRVVGGTFMNSGGVSTLAPPPDQSKLQPLFRKTEADGDVLQPFFTDSGETPWGEVIQEASGSSPKKERVERPPSTKKEREEASKSLLSMLQNNSRPETETGPKIFTSNDLDGVFMTDGEVTARSQKEKVGTDNATRTPVPVPVLEPTPQTQLPMPQSEIKKISKVKALRKEYSQRSIAIEQELKDWLQSLPQSPPTKHFGDFRFDTEKIMQAMNSAIN